MTCDYVFSVFRGTLYVMEDMKAIKDRQENQHQHTQKDPGRHSREELLLRATKNVADIIAKAIEHKPGEGALVIYDTENDLTNILTEAYRAALPEATFLDFSTMKSKEETIAAIDSMKAGDLVVLIQTSNFRLDDFRIRLHLFKQKFKVIEHNHLYRNSREVWDVYIDALAYDPDWYRGLGRRLQGKLATTDTLVISGMDSTLTVTGGLESPKPNLGDYTGMENIGGTFPIGEVFTESLDFSKMNGSFYVYAFAGSDFSVNMHEPFRVDVQEGVVVSWADNAPENFGAIVSEIRTNERPIIREIGFGLNRAITKERYPEDVTAFERILGMHLSMGEKHSVYKKEGITTHKARYHVDLFPVVEKTTADGTTIFENGVYKV